MKLDEYQEEIDKIEAGQMDGNVEAYALILHDQLAKALWQPPYRERAAALKERLRQMIVKGLPYTP